MTELATVGLASLGDAMRASRERDSRLWCSGRTPARELEPETSSPAEE
jgi:hypothetical protein